MDSGELDGVRKRLLAVDAATVSDVLDDMGIHDQGVAPAIQAVSGTRLAGWAYPICGGMLPYTAPGDEAKMAACHGIAPGQVSVWAGDGQGICYFGELISLGMMERGATGALVDGGVRDTRALREHGFPVFARYRSAVQSIGRWRVTDYDVPVMVRGATSAWVTVRPGDFVLADEDGAIVIPREAVADVLDRAERQTATEIEIRESIRRGASLSAALAEYGHV